MEISGGAGAVSQHQASSKLLERIQQRKQLFVNKTVDTSNTAKASTFWKQSTFSGDDDGKMSAKFRRLMGMKDGDRTTTAVVPVTGTIPSSSATAATSPSVQGSDTLNSQQKHFADLEKQYEVARRVTHTQKGLGLGFGSSLS